MKRGLATAALALILGCTPSRSTAPARSGEPGPVADAVGEERPPRELDPSGSARIQAEAMPSAAPAEEKSEVRFRWWRSFPPDHPQAPVSQTWVFVEAANLGPSEYLFDPGRFLLLTPTDQRASGQPPLSGEPFDPVVRPGQIRRRLIHFPIPPALACNAALLWIGGQDWRPTVPKPAEWESVPGMGDLLSALAAAPPGALAWRLWEPPWEEVEPWVEPFEAEFGERDESLVLVLACVKGRRRPGTISPADFLLHFEGRRIAPWSLPALPSPIPSMALEPGESVAGLLAFRVPADARPHAIEAAVLSFQDRSGVEPVWVPARALSPYHPVRIAEPVAPSGWQCGTGLPPTGSRPFGLGIR